jgi:hypothetical protein
MYEFESTQNYKAVKHMTETMIVMQLCNMCGETPYTVKVIRLREMAWTIRHACIHIGIVAYPMHELQLIDGRTVLYAYCAACKRIWYFVS